MPIAVNALLALNKKGQQQIEYCSSSSDNSVSSVHQGHRVVKIAESVVFACEIEELNCCENKFVSDTVVVMW